MRLAVTVNANVETISAALPVTPPWRKRARNGPPGARLQISSVASQAPSIHGDGSLQSQYRTVKDAYFKIR